MDLIKKKCVPCEGGTKPFAESEILEHLKEVSGWTHQNGCITKTYSFKNYYEATSFVNAVVWIAHTEDHHPEIHFGYKTCRIEYSTHAIGGISENDFICAAKIEKLLEGH